MTEMNKRLLEKSQNEFYWKCQTEVRNFLRRNIIRMYYSTHTIITIFSNLCWECALVFGVGGASVFMMATTWPHYFDGCCFFNVWLFLFDSYKLPVGTLVAMPQSLWHPTPCSFTKWLLRTTSCDIYKAIQTLWTFQHVHSHIKHQIMII